MIAWAFRVPLSNVNPSSSYVPGFRKLATASTNPLSFDE